MTKKPMSKEMIEAREQMKKEMAAKKEAARIKAEAAEKEKARKAAEAEAKKKAAEEKKAAEAAKKAEQEAKNKAILEAAKEAEAKRLEEAAKASDEEKPQAKQPEAQKVTGLTEEGKKEQEEKAEILKTKTFYKTAGHFFEISPNIQDLQYNGANKEHQEQIQNILKEAGHWDHSKGKPNTFSEAATEKYKENGEIKIIPIRFKGHDETQYQIFLIPKKEITIKVLEKVNYTWDSKNGKSAAKALGRDNREYTFEGIQTITLKAGQAILLGSTTNGGKAINNYGSHWANIYKVHFPKAQYGDIKNLKVTHFSENNNLLDLNQKITTKGNNNGLELKTQTYLELIQAESFYDMGHLVG
jgi:hypothetical protein